MKSFKFILLAITLLLGGNAWADGISYTQVNAAAGKMIQIQSYYKGGNYIYVNGSNVQVSTAQSDSRFILETAADGGFYLKHKDTGKYAGRTPNGSSQAVPAVEGTETAGRYTFEAATPDCNPASGSFNQSTTCVYVKCLNPGNATYPAFHYSGTNGNVINWDGNHSGGGNAWVVTAIEEVPTVPVGPSAEDIQALQEKIDPLMLNYGKVGYPDAEAVLAYNSNFSGEVTADNYDDALAAYNAYMTSTTIKMPEEGKAYNLIICDPNGGKYYMYRNNDGQLATSTTEPVGNTAKFVVSNVSGGNMTFAVEGEYVQWFCTESSKCYNGNTKGLSATTNAATTLTVEKATATNYGSGNIEGATTESLLGKVQIKGPGKTGSWYYNFRTDGAFISQYAGDKFYDDNWDNGRSGLWRTCFFEIEETELIVKNAWTDLEETLALADEYIVGEGYGEYTLAAGDWTTAIANAEAELATHTTEAKAEALNTTITDYIAALTLNLPAAGSFVTLQNVHGTYLNGAAATTGVAARVAEPSLFYYDENGHLIGYPGGFALNNGPAALLGASTATYQFVKGTAKGKLAVKNTANKYLMDWADGRLNDFETIESTCNFTIGKTTALPVHVSGAKYATLYAPVALTIPSDVEAYTLTFDGTYLQATAISGIIPANTAVVLEANEGDYEFAYTTGGTAANNDLQGTVATIAKSGNPLVLGLDQYNVAGFYSLEGDNLGGFKAYYESAAASNIRISFGVVTDIISAAKENAGHAIYDLQGRRVVSGKGLFIQNGKKVVK